MIKQVILLLAVLGSIASTQAQTRRIAHKSHSGNAANYKKFLVHKPFAIGASNFGEGLKLHERLDSVIYVDEHTSILVTSREDMSYVKNQPWPRWVRYRDVIHNSPLLSKKHSLDSIRYVYARNGHFVNSMNEVKFIGYDNKKPLPKKTK